MIAVGFRHPKLSGTATIYYRTTTSTTTDDWTAGDYADEETVYVTTTTTYESEQAPEFLEEEQAAYAPEPKSAEPRQPLGFAGLAAGGCGRTRVGVRPPRLASDYG